MENSREDLIKMRDTFREVADLYDEGITLIDKADNNEISDEDFEKQFASLAGKLTEAIIKMHLL